MFALQPSPGLLPHEKLGRHKFSRKGVDPMTNPKAERSAEERWKIFSVLAENYPYELAKQEAIKMYLAGWSACAKEQGELLGCLEETLEIVWAGHTEQVGKMLCKHALDRLRAHRLGEEGKT